MMPRGEADGIGALLVIEQIPTRTVRGRPEAELAVIANGEVHGGKDGLRIILGPDARGVDRADGARITIKKDETFNREIIRAEIPIRMIGQREIDIAARRETRGAELYLRVRERDRGAGGESFGVPPGRIDESAGEELRRFPGAALEMHQEDDLVER